MTSNEGDFRDLYLVAAKEPKRFRSLFTRTTTGADIAGGVKYHGDDLRCAADIWVRSDMYRALDGINEDGDDVVVQLSLNGTHQR